MDTFTLEAVRAAVLVKETKKNIYEIVEGSIRLIGPDTKVYEVPPKWKILSPDGDIIQPAGKFLMTVETIGQYHLLIEEKSGLW